MEQKLIALDLDGTTLNNESQISLKTESVLKQAQAAGHIITIVTGRPNKLALNYYDQLNLTTPMINFNGSLGFIPHQQWGQEYELTFNKRIAFNILNNKHELGIKVMAAEGKNFALADVPNDVLGGYFPAGKKSTDILNKMNLQKDPTSMMLLVDPTRKEETVTKLENEFGDKITVSVWGGPNPVLEISPKGINKEYGVRYLANYFNISRKNIIAFGDEHNDAEMLNFAGWGVAMKNGTSDIKNIANDVTMLDNDHDGLAYYLEDYLKLA